jgi:murein DD-endopeptidase MepM/ murein hydrolase activator NlpD
MQVNAWEAAPAKNISTGFRWIAILSLLLLYVAARPPRALAATPKKRVPKPAKATKSPKKARAAAALPSRPTANIPVVTEAASVWEGCLASPELPVLASRLGMDPSRLESLLSEEGLLGSEGGDCSPYIAATGGEGGVASAMFQPAEAKEGTAPVFTLRKTADGVTVTPGACTCPETTRRALILPTHEVAEKSSEALANLPASVKWQLDVLTPLMTGRFAPEPPEGYTMRIVVEKDAEAQPERLRSIEVLEPTTGKRLDGVWWLERPGGPGTFIGMQGLSYQRLLWQSPVRYVQKSRGPGPIVNTFQRRVPAPKKSLAKKATIRTVAVRGFHLGVDLMAPKGYEVHAVGDATVSFSGWQGGFGNVIILDHGRGYQTYYAHLSLIESGVKPGAKIAAGELIGLVGSTGHSTGPHLHFETRKDGKYLDPFDDTRQLDFWLLTADDQERLAMQLLAPGPGISQDRRVVETPN